MRAEILKLLRARGAFAGISSMAQRSGPMRTRIASFTAISTSAAKIITESDVAAPAAAHDLIAALQKSSPQLKR